MNTTITNATEYRNLPLALLTESTTNPRRIFEDDCLEGVGREHPHPGRSLAFACAAHERAQL